MNALGILGFVFGLMGFITASKNTKKIYELENEISILKEKIKQEK